MFSNDRNIETIGKLIEVFRHYIGLQNEYLRLDIVEKMARLITALSIFFVLFLLILVACIYLSFSAAYAMAPSLGYPVSFVIVAAFYLVLLIAFMLFRKQLVERPLVRFLVSILMEK